MLSIISSPGPFSRLEINLIPPFLKIHINTSFYVFHKMNYSIYFVCNEFKEKQTPYSVSKGRNSSQQSNSKLFHRHFLKSCGHFLLNYNLNPLTMYIFLCVFCVSNKTFSTTLVKFSFSHAEHGVLHE